MLEDFISAEPQKAAAALEQMALSEAVFWVSGLRASSLIACLQEMNPKKAAFLLRRLNIKQAARILQGLSAGSAGEIMLSLPLHYKKRLIDTLEPNQIKALEDVISYPDESAARFMKGDFLSFKTDTKLKDIAAKLKSIPAAKMPVCVFIADKSGRLCGVLPAAQLALNSPESLAGSVMLKEFVKLTPFESVSRARALFAQNSTALLPVTDSDGILLGVLCLWDLDKPVKKPAALPQKQDEEPKQKKYISFIICLLLLLLAVFVIILKSV